MALGMKALGNVSFSANIGRAFLSLTCCFVLGCDPSADQKQVEASGWDASRLEAELAEVFGESDPYKRLLQLAEVLPQMNAQNAAGAGSALSQSHLRTGRSESDPIMSRWVFLDAPAALEWTNSRGGSQARDVISQAIYSWVAVDGGAKAVAFLAEVPPSTERFKIVRNNIIKGVGAAGDLAIANDILGGMPDEDARQFLLLQLTLELMRKDKEAAKVWLDSLPNDAPNGLKQSAFGLILEISARLDPASAAQWYDSLGLQPYKKGTVMLSVAAAYVLKDPGAAYDWMLSQPPSETRKSALRDATYMFLKKQPMEAYEFLRGNMANEGMGPTIYAYAHFYSSGDPVEALEWAIRVPDHQERDKAILLPLQLLGRRDIDAARKWLEENSEYVSEINRTKFDSEFETDES
jgi:hypothetical protein